MLAGQYQQKYFQQSGLQDGADPWIMAEAKERGAVVVTYEGITFSGDPAKKAEKKLPARCVQEASDAARCRGRSKRSDSNCDLRRQVAQSSAALAAITSPKTTQQT